MNKKIPDEGQEDDEEVGGTSLFGQIKNNELYNDELYVVHPIVRIKRVSFKGCDMWEIIDNNVRVLTIRASYLSKKEQQIMYTPEGLTYVLNAYKSGNTSVAAIKRKLKHLLK